MNLFKLLGNLGNLNKIQEEIQLITQELSQRTFDGSAGGGMVVITVTGTHQVISCTIDPKLVADNDRELIEDLVAAAINEAFNMAKRQSAEFMQKRLSEKFDLPELSGLINNFMPK